MTLLEFAISLGLDGIDAAQERGDRLMRNALSLPDVREEHVRPAVLAALQVETPRIPAELLVSIAWGESRFVPTVVSAVGACGPLQVVPYTVGEKASVCRTWASDSVEAFRAGVKELRIMLADRRTNGSIRSVLLYRACGNAAFKGTCHATGWPGWVLARSTKLGR